MDSVEDSQGPFEEGRVVGVSQEDGSGLRRSWRCRMSKTAPGLLWVAPEPGECKRGTPKPSIPTRLTVQTDHLGWENDCVLVGQDGSRIDPVFAFKLDGDWRILLRRTALRIKADTTVDLLVPDPRRPEQVSIVRGRLVDVSVSGCRVRAMMAARPGTILTIRFTLPGIPKEMAIMCQVVRCDSVEASAASEVGCRFIQAPEATLTRLREWFAAREEPVAS